MSNPKRYPRWITTPDGNRMIVPDHQTHSAMMGQEFDENAEPVVKAEVSAPAEELATAIEEPQPQTFVPIDDEDLVGMFGKE